MFSLVQFESSLKLNLFRRSISNYSKSIFVENDIKEMKFYVLERLLNKHVYRRDKGESIKYLVKWQRYGSKFDT